MNTEGYWDVLIQLLNHVVDQGFAAPSLLDYVEPVADADAALPGNVLAGTTYLRRSTSRN